MDSADDGGERGVAVFRAGFEGEPDTDHFERVGAENGRHSYTSPGRSVSVTISIMFAGYHGYAARGKAHRPASQT